MPPRSKGKTIEWIACQHCNDLYTSKDIKFHADICVQNNSADVRESFPEYPSIFRRADADGLTATKRVFLTPVGKAQSTITFNVMLLLYLHLLTASNKSLILLRCIITVLNSVSIFYITECCIVDTSIVAENSRPCCFLHPSTISSCCYEQAKYVVVNGSYVFEVKIVASSMLCMCYCNVVSAYWITRYCSIVCWVCL